MSEHEQNISTENEKKVLIIIIITLITMLLEIVYGYVTKSMALLADGYHMGTHALALGLTYVAYILARLYANSEKFPCGTDKIGTLAGYTSSIFLGLTGVWIIFEGIVRFFSPIKIVFNEAMLIAFIGLIVNLICIFIMERKEHTHCEKEGKDYNFMSAYYHILADVMTSVLAIVALMVGKYFGIFWLDAGVGILGGLLIIRWAVLIIKDTVKILVDCK